MRRTLLVSNDFPPRPGGIESYLSELLARLPPERLVAYVPGRTGATGFDPAFSFPVLHHPGSVLLPVPRVAARAAGIAREYGCQAVWFGAAAPLALLAGPLRRAGVTRAVACTHGHEVGWAMAPGGRTALRRIGRSCDVVTTVSNYTRHRVAAGFGPCAALEPLAPGVDAERFAPDPEARAVTRRRHRLGQAPVIACVGRLVPRKGQDVLIRALPEIRRRVPGTVLLLVGEGRYERDLRRLAARCGVDAAVTWAPVPAADVPGYLAAADVFAMPCRTRGAGLDVEGLGMAFLEAAAAGLPVVAGDSGGAPETVREGKTGHVVDGRDVANLARRIAALLADPDRAAALGRAGREWMRTEWGWDRPAARLRAWLSHD